MHTHEIENRLRASMLSVCRSLGLQGRQDGDELVALNPTRHDKGLGSFRIALSGAKVGVWRDFASDDGGAGPMSLVHYILGHNGDWKRTYAWANNFLGCDTRAQSENYKTYEGGRGRKSSSSGDKKAKAEAMWIDGQPSIKGTLAEDYLAGRGLDLHLLGRQPSILRFTEKCWSKDLWRYHPALLAAYHDCGGAFAGVHRIYLPDENGEVPQKRKAALGSYRGAYARVWRGMINGCLQPAFAKADWQTDTVYVTEGIEDALAVAMLDPHLRVVSAIGVTNFQNLRFADCIKNVVLVADNDAEDSAAEKSLYAGGRALQAKGYAVSISRSPVGKDFADAMKAKMEEGAA